MKTWAINRIPKSEIRKRKVFDCLFFYALRTLKSKPSSQHREISDSLISKLAPRKQRCRRVTGTITIASGWAQDVKRTNKPARH